MAVAGAAKKSDSTPSFEEVFQKLRKNDKFVRLVRKGVSEDFLEVLLRWIDQMPDKKPPKPPKYWRMVTTMVGKLEKLAKELRMPIYFAPVWTSVPESQRLRLQELPTLLCEFAGVWSKLITLRAVPLRVNLRRSLIVQLLENVKKQTGSYHYNDIAILLNELDYERRPRPVFWDVDILKQMVYRENHPSKSAKKIIRF